MPLTATTGSGQRERILAVARGLMSEKGAHTMSMRTLASACGLNVATIYHYFPSKADLLRSVIEERRYPAQLAAESPRADPSLPPRERLAQLVGWVLRTGVLEQDTWKLLMGETIRGDATAAEATADLIALLDDTFAGWLADHFPELRTDPEAAARVLRGQIIACFFEDLMTRGHDRRPRFATRAADVAALVFP